MQRPKFNFVFWFAPRDWPPTIVNPNEFIDFGRDENGDIKKIHNKKGEICVSEEWICTWPYNAKYWNTATINFITPLKIIESTWKYFDGNYLKYFEIGELEYIDELEKYLKESHDFNTSYIAELNLLALTTPSMKIMKEWEDNIIRKKIAINQFQDLIANRVSKA